MWNSLRARLTIIFITLAIAPLLVIGVILAQRTYSTERDSAFALQNQVAQNVSSSVNSYYQGVVNNMDSLGDEIRNLTQPDRSQSLSILLNALSTGSYQNDYQELTLLNATGQEQVRVSHQGITPISGLQDQSGSDIYKGPITAHGAYFSPVSSDKASGVTYITISIPVYEPRSVQLIGVLVARMKFSTISDVISQVPTGEGETVYITDATGRLLAHQDRSFNLQNAHIILPAQNNIQTGVGGANVVIGVKGLQLGDQKLEVIAEQPVSDALSLAYVLIATLIITGIVTLLIAGGLGFMAVRQIVLPIEALASTTKRIAEGDLSQQAIVSSRDEIGTLAASFNSMTERLQDTLRGLEQRVNDRTAELQSANKKNEQRARQFEALSQATRAMSSIRNLSELLPRVAAVISEYFGYYHVGIFLNDENGEFTYLTAANSEGGQRMLAREHSLKIGEQGIVGHVAAANEVRIAHKVGEDAIFFDNPDLPETKSEAALPLHSGNRVIGVLDLQSTKEFAFTQEDINVLAILADQVSLAIENARTFETTQRSLTEAETLYRQYLRQAWSRLPREQQVSGVRYTSRGASILETPVVLGSDVETDREKGDNVIFPIKLRNETIGNLSIHVPQDTHLGPDQMDLIQAVAERLALSAENARLFDETSRRAERERLVTEITSKIRSTNDPEAMIKTALNELRNALGATQVQLIPQAISISQSPDNEVVTSTPRESTEKAPRGNGAKQ